MQCFKKVSKNCVLIWNYDWLKIVSYNIMPPLMNKMNIFAAIRKIYSSRNMKENNIQSS